MRLYNRDSLRAGFGGQIKMIETEVITEAILENKRWLYNLAYSITRDPEDAKDAVGNAIVKAYVNKDSIKKKDSINAWLYRIVNNEAYNILRKKKHALSLDEVDEDVCAEDEIENYIGEMNIWDIVLQMPEKYRAIICLFYGRDMDIKTIHKITGIPIGTVKSRLNRAREFLRDRLEEGGEYHAI